MRIGLICYQYKPSGGAERYLDTLARQFIQMGHQVLLFAHRWRKNDSQLQFIRIPTLSFASPFRVLSFALGARKAVRRIRPDVVLSLERTIEQDVVRAGGGCHRSWLEERMKYVPWWKRLAIRLDPLHWVLLRLERRMFSPRCTGWVIANSLRVKREISSTYFFPEDRIRVIYNGVDLRHFRPVEKEEWTPFRIVFVGSGFERKGLRFAVECFARLPKEAQLWIVGKGRIQPYQALAARLGVAHRIRYLGSDLDLRPVFAQAHLLLHPTIYDPFANVCLEALASGLPVVTTRQNGVAENLEQGISGFVVEEAGSVEELAVGVRWFMAPDRWKQASVAARKVAERFPVERNARETLDLLLQVAAVRRGGPSSHR